MPLSALENVLQAWLREQLPLPADVGDISFDSPDATWSTALTRPTVNLFLFDIARAAQPSLPVPPRRDQSGTLVQDRPAPCVSFSYLLSTWGGGVREEHRLLGDAVRAVLRTPALSPEPESQELVGPIQISLSEANEVRARELWSGLGGRLRAGMVLVAMTAVPLGRPVPRPTSVQTVTAEVASMTTGGRTVISTILEADADPATGAEPATGAGSPPARRSGPDPVQVESSVVEGQSPRRFVLFGPRQRGRGKP
jgi:hypothetical protein